LKINRSCQTCHHFPEDELKARVEDIQDRFFTLRNTALDALIDLIADIKDSKQKGATDAQLASARDYQRRGQFMIDFVMSENSMGFHAPQEAMRILGDAINLCRLGQLSLHWRSDAQPQPSEYRRDEGKELRESGGVRASAETVRRRFAGNTRPLDCVRLAPQLRSERVTLLIFSTPIMLSGSAAQAAVESKYPRSACEATTVDTFLAGYRPPYRSLHSLRLPPPCNDPLLGKGP